MKEKTHYFVISIILLLLVTGCNSGNKADDIDISALNKNAISPGDITILDNNNQKVYLGMSRKSAEKILGSGEQSEEEKNNYDYEHGVKIIYVNDKVIAISLSSESENFYRTIRGVHIGMLKDKVINLYGEEYIEEGPMGDESLLAYMYDSTNKKYLKSSTQDHSDSQIYRVALSLDKDGLVTGMGMLPQFVPDDF
ncbi:hypothetical protein EHV15_01390 [Paenibacillus oralis]|uniref:Uncharacterized protein n=1 Tax=Paenibacillus oralis TaxID=2490856 RepID=A0A3P3TUI1_9BACL|nr:hypothetical protein [Paenibacillus oralis]RRJ61777.1 hypothetical protein EHV15_01390 [Paenibacillus oralis]